MTIASYIKKNIILSIIAVMTLCIIAVSTYKYNKESDINFMDNFTCKAKLKIERDTMRFSGVIDINVVQGKGSLRIDGVSDVDNGKYYTIQRTIIFYADKENSNPTWKSKEVITTHLDDIPDDITVHLLPAFYIKPTTVTNIDMETLKDGTLLITKSHLPYLYCSGF
ncbi:hypothetical protein [Buttiauxella gaviniae]|uniref:hypothetical protein n=1 Tax=Buttiauxella gaviniae TaxID=82990 RepID=UPI0039762B55